MYNFIQLVSCFFEEAIMQKNPFKTQISFQKEMISIRISSFKLLIVVDYHYIFTASKQTLQQLISSRSAYIQLQMGD